MEKLKWIIFILVVAPLDLFCQAEVREPHGLNMSIENAAESDTIISRLRNLFHQEALYQRLSGVVLVARGDSVIYEDCFGISKHLRSSPYPRYNIGSLTKQFTAAAILKLQQLGKLSLYDPINKHLGNWASPRWKKVTIHQLLTHTSGIPSLYQTDQGLPIFFPEEDPISLNDLIDQFRNAKLLFKAGEEFSYSNSGYVLLAAIIEQCTGETYQNFMESFLESYTLKNTSLSAYGYDAKPFYGYRNDLLTSAPSYHYSWSIGAGGIFSTAKDLNKWLSIIQSDTFLTTDLRRRFLEKHTRIGYGYGWQFDKDGRVSHDGGTAGFTSFLAFNPTNNYRVILLTNRGHRDIDKYGISSNYVRSLVNRAWSILEHENPQTLPSISRLSQIEQVYEIRPGLNLRLKSENDTAVWVGTTGSLPTRIVANSPLDGSTENGAVLLEVAKKLSAKKYWSMAKYCDGEMKFVCYAGLMGIGMKMIRGRTGRLQSIHPYAVDERYGLLRAVGDRQIADIIVYFDESGKISGLFEHGYYSLDQEVPMLAYPVTSNKLFIDGLHEGEEDLMLTISENAIQISQKGRKIHGKAIDPERR